MKIFKLINKKSNQCELIFVPVRDNEFTHSLSGMLLATWGNYIATDIDFDFIADVLIKWDGCSHFSFFGEDYIGDTKDENTCNGYYHICGFNSYIRHFRSMVFAWQLAINKLGDKFDKNYEIPEYEEFKEHIDLLDDYEIKEETLKKEDSVLWYKLKDLLGNIEEKGE